MAAEQQTRETGGAERPASDAGRSPPTSDSPAQLGHGRTRHLAWLLSIRDFSWRARRYLIAALATSLLLGLALLLSGVQGGFSGEAKRTLAFFDAHTWLVRADSTGPFTDPVPFTLSGAARATALAGTRADPVFIADAASRGRTVHLVGVVPGRVGSGGARTERLLRSGLALVDDSLGVRAGAAIPINGLRFTVGQVTHGMTYFAGVPIVVLGLSEAEKVRVTPQPVATALIVRGRLRSVPAGFRALGVRSVRSDLESPLARAKQTITLIRTLLWIIAAGVIGSIVYLGALERVRDFAILKAIGVPTRSLLLGLTAQALVLSITSAALAIGVCAAMASQVSMVMEVGASSYAALFVLAIGVGLLASLAALRRAVSVDPASAFGA